MISTRIGFATPAAFAVWKAAASSKLQVYAPASQDAGPAIESSHVDEVRILAELNEAASRISDEVRISETAQEMIESILQQT